MRFVVLFLVLFLAVSCLNRNIKPELKEIVEYYENDSVKSVGYLLNDEFVGRYERFFPNGTSEVVSYYKEGKKDSIQKVFYKNGEIRQISFFKNGLINGDVLSYSPEGILLDKQSFVILKDSSYVNQVVTYNKNGYIDKTKSNYFSLFAKKDTIEFGDLYEIDIKLEASLYNLNMLAIIGAFDANYNLMDSSKVDTLWDRLDGEVDFQVTYSTKYYDYGNNLIRGIIHDYATYYADTTMTTVRKNVRPLYFQKEFYVKL